MKFIHTADLHLDSPLGNVKNGNERRSELITAFCTMVNYAKNNGVTAVVVAGDMFDGDFALASTIASVAEVIENSGLQWFVLKGNHGSAKPYTLLAKYAPRVRFFGDEWTKFDVENVTFTGRELGYDDEQQWQNLVLDPSRFNVLVLHGDTDNNTYGFIDGKAIAESGAQYVALGHRHAYCQHMFGRVKGAYCGVLETRGFDENAETGFVVVDTDTNKIQFVPQHYRKVQNVNVDLTGVENNIQLQNRTEKALQDVSEGNYLCITFTGTQNENVNTDSVKNYLQNKYYALRIVDNTLENTDLQALSQEISLRGEFVRLASKITDENMRKSVIRVGLLALDGREVEL